MIKISESGYLWFGNVFARYLVYIFVAEGCGNFVVIQIALLVEFNEYGEHDGGWRR